MKKLMTSVLIMVFLLGMGTFAYAGTNTDNTATDKKALIVQKREAVQQKVQNVKALKTQFQPQIDEIKANRAEIQQLRAQAREARTAAMQHIKDLKVNPDQLTDTQIAELKQAKDAFKQIKLDLADTKGDIHTEMLAMKAARKDQNVEQVQASLDQIIAIQQNRMELIQNAIDEMNQILEI